MTKDEKGDGSLGSAEADPRSLAEAQRLQRATGAAVAVIQAARLHLLAEVATSAPGRAAVVDGEAAMVDGEGLEPATWLRDRIRDLCSHGTLNEAIEELKRESLADAVEELAAYVREHREEILRMASAARTRSTSRH